MGGGPKQNNDELNHKDNADLCGAYNYAKET
jgi:hypothetical protein